MKTLTLAFILALLATGTAARAASHEHHHDTAMQQAATTYVGTGVLKSVNAKDGKVQIAHEPIAELDWPAMTMWFTLREPLPKSLKTGDAVRFEMIQGEKKQWVIEKIERK